MIGPVGNGSIGGLMVILPLGSHFLSIPLISIFRGGKCAPVKINAKLCILEPLRSSFYLLQRFPRGLIGFPGSCLLFLRADLPCRQPSDGYGHCHDHGACPFPNLSFSHRLFLSYSSFHSYYCHPGHSARFFVSISISLLSLFPCCRLRKQFRSPPSLRPVPSRNTSSRSLAS